MTPPLTKEERDNIFRDAPARSWMYWKTFCESLLDDLERVKAERDEWADTARSEMAGRRMAEDRVSALEELRQSEVALACSLSDRNAKVADEQRLARVVEILDGRPCPRNVIPPCPCCMCRALAAAKGEP